MSTPNIRGLIERALREAQEEFAAIVERKLAELMGDPMPATVAPRAKRAEPQAAPKASKAASRSRVPADHMDSIRQKILGAMEPGAALKKSQIMAAARLGDDDAQRVGLVLRRLKDEGLLAMRGQKGAATYSLKAPRRREEAESAATK